MKITKETRKHRKAWFKALRSEEYGQAHHELIGAYDHTFCCLGVACDISDLGHWDAGAYLIGEPEDADFETDACELTPSMMVWLGMTRTAMNHAVNMNDDERKTFVEIADHFEARWRA